MECRELSTMYRRLRPRTIGMSIAIVAGTIPAPTAARISADLSRSLLAATTTQIKLIFNAILNPQWKIDSFFFSFFRFEILIASQIDCCRIIGTDVIFGCLCVCLWWNL